MEVDEIGLFSVASSRWGNAFASIMSHHCKKTLNSNPEETIAIDLTASVGGVTLPLAKSFMKVIAIEIDEHRAKLCHRNMQNNNFAEKVEIINDDSIETIPKIAKDILGKHPKVVVVDPPWGGKYYKHESNEIKMGIWSMLDVVNRMSKYLSPTIIGIRMPVSFDADLFFELLHDDDVNFVRLEVKKAGPQLFLTFSV